MTVMTSSMEIEILGFDSIYADDFARLNYEWIDKYFQIEQHDRELLDHPYEQIIKPGGEIFFALSDRVAAGTAAMIGFDEETFELSKMAVAPELQGRGNREHADGRLHSICGHQGRVKDISRDKLKAGRGSGPLPKIRFQRYAA